MMKTIKHIVVFATMASLLYTLPVLLTSQLSQPIFAAKAEQVKKKKNSRSVKVPAMRNRVYTQLARAQSLADAGDKPAGFEVLKQVESRINQLNAYERAMLWNFYGFMYYGDDDITNAIASFEKVVAEDAIPDSLYNATLYSLAQLAMQQQDYDKTLDFLTRWQTSINKPLKPMQQVLFAQAHYQNKNYLKASDYVNLAVAQSEEAGELPKENWLILQRAAFYELKQPHKVTEVMEKLVRLYEKPQYWVQLAGMYGETEQEDKQLAVMETAYQAGYLTKQSQLVGLAQLYMFHDVPYKAAALLKTSMASGSVVSNEKHLALTAQAYIAAKEEQKAIAPLKQATALAKHGKYDAMLAQTYLNMEQWQHAINFAGSALTKGQLDREGDMHLVDGMARFNLAQYDQAIVAFEQAKAFDGSEKMATQWTKYVLREKQHQLQLAMMLDSDSQGE
ncbi:tetratricopeptide repeat protein [Thalassotalea agarivorans]|nr:hypothetical protein [Thalassotalea agarivorans]